MKGAAVSNQADHVIRLRSPNTWEDHATEVQCAAMSCKAGMQVVNLQILTKSPANNLIFL